LRADVEDEVEVAAVEVARDGGLVGGLARVELDHRGGGGTDKGGCGEPLQHHDGRELTGAKE
jgi:hypothetical protein